MKRILSRIIGAMGYSLVRRSRLDGFNRAIARARDLDFLAAMPEAQVGRLLSLLPESQAQLRQDLFVLSELGFRREGYFVEFGAANGKSLSNTWLLEKHFGWTGIVAEPARCWHAELARHRGCVIDHRCVWKRSGDRLGFSQAPEAELSTISTYEAGDMHAKARRDSSRYEVETVGLEDLLAGHRAPDSPDYLSIDTEGSELEILSSYDFARRPFKVITCEHNHTPAREAIHRLLTKAGYVRKYEKLSDFDDWYVRA